jgi:hypothetical protein
MATTTLDIDLLPALDQTWVVLEDMCDKNPVMMQKVMELMMVRYTGKMGSLERSLFVTKHMQRHAEQLLKQLFETP